MANTAGQWHTLIDYCYGQHRSLDHPFSVFKILPSKWHEFRASLPAKKNYELEMRRMRVRLADVLRRFRNKWLAVFWHHLNGEDGERGRSRSDRPVERYKLTGMADTAGQWHAIS